MLPDSAHRAKLPMRAPEIGRDVRSLRARPSAPWHGTSPEGCATKRLRPTIRSWRLEEHRLLVKRSIP
eukprot:3226764-Alexandrium_andersonii.AAC.1